MFNYTWSKATGMTGGPYGSNYAESQTGTLGMASAGGVDYRNLNNDKGLLNYDVTNRVVVVLSYELPFARGGRLQLNNRVLRAIAGGWQLASVITLQGGQPWGPGCGTVDGRCNQVPGQQFYGDGCRRSADAGFYNTNLTVSRHFRVTERIDMEMLAEATNALNRTNIDPNAVNGSVGMILAQNAATNAQVGQNSNSAAGTMNTNFYEPRQISLSLRLRF
jgi:hypothetical protein